MVIRQESDLQNDGYIQTDRFQEMDICFYYYYLLIVQKKHCTINAPVKTSQWNKRENISEVYALSSDNHLFIFVVCNILEHRRRICFSYSSQSATSDVGL